MSGLQREGIGGEVHPDDVERLNRALWLFYEWSCGVRKGDGSFVGFCLVSTRLHDEKGQIKRLVYASTDMTTARIEEKLHRKTSPCVKKSTKASMFEEIVGTSPALKSVLSRVSKVAPSDSTVLITGEQERVKSLLRGLSTDDQIVLRVYSLV